MQGRLVGRGVAAAVLVVLIGGCAGGGSGGSGMMSDIEQNKALTIGGLGGAAGGGLLAAALHANPAGIAAGVILGGLTGGLIGHLVDNKDKELAAQTTQRALESTPSGTSLPWKNPSTGHTGTVEPVRTYQNAAGSYCREYTDTVTIDGRPQRSYGTACRQPDGSWKNVN